MEENILEVKNLSVNFGQEKILENVSFSLKEKEKLVILGPNGAGKTILLKCLLGMISHLGEIKWKKDLKIGYVPQKILIEKNLPMSVEEFFKMKNFFPARKKIGRDLILESLNSVGITDQIILKKKIGNLSHGQLQRVLIAWALVSDPSMILFDEPTAGIDLEGEETIYNLLAKIEKTRDLSILFVTHDLSVVYKFADSVLCLNKKAICYGEPSDILVADNLNKLYGGDIKIYSHNHNYQA